MTTGRINQIAIVVEAPPLAGRLCFSDNVLRFSTEKTTSTFVAVVAQSLPASPLRGQTFRTVEASYRKAGHVRLSHRAAFTPFP